MLTTNKIFLDSSLFVEVYKNNHQAFFHDITQSNALECCVSDIVCSEYWYQVIGLIGKVSPLTSKEKYTIGQHISQNQPVFDFYKEYLVLESLPDAIPIALRLMQSYNLLPNDALILATCKTHGIFFLASHDSDFVTACNGEGVQLVNADNYLQLLPQL